MSSLTGKENSGWVAGLNQSCWVGLVVTGNVVPGAGGKAPLPVAKIEESREYG